jgi:two-component system, chemotaxis family, chemotaxis protein CheY
LDIASLRFLVVDDMVTIRRSVTTILTSLGVTNVSGANTGKLAWEMIVKAAEEKTPFQIVICDWHMPDITGLELVQKCRANNNTKNIGFLMLTSETETAKVVEAMLQGVDNYLVKPVDAEAFKSKLNMVIKKRFSK